MSECKHLGWSHTVDGGNEWCAWCEIERLTAEVADQKYLRQIAEGRQERADKRIGDLERALAHSDNECDAFQSHYYRVCDELAQETSAKITAEALVLGHEGHIETLDKRIEELEENIRTVVEDPYYLRFLGNALKEQNNADAT